MEEEEISLLADELIQLSVKSSLVSPRSQFSLLCLVWRNKSYNSNSLCVQLRSYERAIALKAESNLVGRESLQLGSTEKKFMMNCLYTGEEEERITPTVKWLEDKATSTEQRTLTSGNSNKLNMLIDEGKNSQEGTKSNTAVGKNSLPEVIHMKAMGEIG
ncbi:hypothetical protein J1N35_001976 [Gossypium stocksii]|uniref:Uncharacterized protein n=1 Tax=Gossypium stocksii TaxID=47602 RepID=A0A9D3WKW3_9ROSI|nr:hypothetical protein J1N35_001976 [Gossypium stocksii]